MPKQNPTYDDICFSVLSYEFKHVDPIESEKKIKRKLNYYKAGKYSQERIDYIRKLKNELLAELSSPEKSIYYKKGSTGFCELVDFDTKRMLGDLLVKYDKLSEPDLNSIIGFSVYLYYLR